MKQWTTPAIEELNINETENGLFPTGSESLILGNQGETWGEVFDNWENGIS